MQELKFQMAVRDQIISEQREVISNLWRILDRSGVGRQRVLDIAKEEGIIMQDFLTQLEEPRPPTVEPHSERSSMDGAGSYAAQVQQDVHAATPNATLAGNRAKMRYRFWAQYHGEGSEGAVGGSGGLDGVVPVENANGGRISEPGAPLSPIQASPSKPRAVSGRRRTSGQNVPAHGGRRADHELPSARQRRGAGIRVDHLAHLHPVPGARRRTGAASGGGDNLSMSPPAATPVPVPVGGSAAARGQPVQSGTVQSGRRAGQPITHHHSASEPADLPHSDPGLEAFGDEEGAGRSKAAAPASGGGGQAQAVPPPPLPPTAPPLGQRLAKLKGRLGKKPDADGAGEAGAADLSGQGAAAGAGRGLVGLGVVSRSRAGALDLPPAEARRRSSVGGG
jgi:hypothetical protein